MSVNRNRKLRSKFNRINSLFSRSIIKVSSNTENKTSYSMALSLLREEIQKVVCISVLVEFNVICCSLVQFSIKKNEVRFLVDLILKVIFLCSKQKIISRMGGGRKLKFFYSSLSNSRLLRDLELEDSELFIGILTWVKLAEVSDESDSLILALIENFSLKLSDSIVFDLFYGSNFSRLFLVEYAVDFLTFRNSLNGLRAYFYLKRIISKGYIFVKRECTFSYLIIVFTKDGFLLKSLTNNYLFEDLTVSIKNTPFSTAISLFYYIVHRCTKM